MTIGEAELLELSNEYPELSSNVAMLISLLKAIKRFESGCLEIGDRQGHGFGVEIGAKVEERLLGILADGNCREK